MSNKQVSFYASLDEAQRVKIDTDIKDSVEKAKAYGAEANRVMSGILQKHPETIEEIKERMAKRMSEQENRNSLYAHLPAEDKVLIDSHIGRMQAEGPRFSAEEWKQKRETYSSEPMLAALHKQHDAHQQHLEREDGLQKAEHSYADTISTERAALLNTKHIKY